MCGVEAFGGPHLMALQLVLALVTMVTFPICLVEFIAMAYRNHRYFSNCDKANVCALLCKKYFLIVVLCD